MEPASPRRLYEPVRGRWPRPYHAAPRRPASRNSNPLPPQLIIAHPIAELNMTPTWPIRRLHDVEDSHLGGLADVLIDCVEGGASVSFMHPLTRDRALGFWRRVAAGVAAGERALLIAEDAHGICGTVQLILDQPENQPHRADLCKMLVHRRARRRGLGAALMRAAESTARECGKSLLVLDAVTDGDAARLYERLGWVRAGDIPGYALFPKGGLCSTTYFFREVGGPGAASPDRR